MRRFRLPFAFLLVNGLLLAPGWLFRGAPGPAWVAGEAVLLTGLLALSSGRPWAGRAARFVAPTVAVLAFFLFADAAARAALSRPMNLYLDWHLLGAIWKLLAGGVGTVPAALLIAGIGAAASLVTWGLGRLLVPERAPRSWRPLRLGGAGFAAFALVGATFWGAGGDVPGPAGVLARGLEWPAARLVGDQSREVGRMLGERETFRVELASSSSHAGVPGLLGKLNRRTVVLAFVESYGVSALHDERYSGVILPRLHELGRRMADSGLHLASGSLVAPTQGGQSWFSHGSVLSGLWLDNQMKYDLLLTTDRETLVDDFRRAGYLTTAIMPAVTLAWPEGEWFGYDRIYAHRDIGYAGPSLNWVTMPDQFTWSFLQRTVRSRAGSRPVFAEVGLISSHAPWTPILPVLDDWEGIGDGSVFAPWENAGERPEELWLDTDRVRDHFALSVDYALHAMIAYAELYVDEEMLLIVMGDHQPAPLITGEGASRAVPVHVVSGDPALVRPFLEWGFEAGPLPRPGGHAPPMDAFREWFVSAFSGAPPGPAPAPGPGLRSTPAVQAP